MAIDVPKVKYTGSIRQIPVGKGNKAFTVGGESAYPFYFFEGDMPNKPRIAFEVLDSQPDDWADALAEVYKDVWNDPVAWSKKCIGEFNADAIMLSLKSTDPNGANMGADEAAQIVKKVADAIDVPLIIWGSGNADKDAEVLRKVAEVCEGKNLIIGPIVEANHKTVGAGAIGFGHTVIASTPIDVNLAKQLNILLTQLGVQEDKIIIDPTTGAVGYGLEYSYSVMERIRMAALAQDDEKLAFPMINVLGNEVWKTKEAKISKEEAPDMGDAKKRAILLEAVSAMLFLLAGSSILVLRHPESAKLVREIINELTEG